MTFTPLLISSLFFVFFSAIQAGTPVILVEKSKITKERIDSLVQLLSKSQFSDRVLNPDEHNYLEKVVAGNLVGQELLLLESKSKSISVPAEEIDSMFALFKSGFPGTTEFQKALKDAGDSEKSLKDKLEKEIKIKKLLEKRLTTISRPSDKEMEDYFLKHKDDFPKNNMLRASQIVFKADKKASVVDAEEKRQELEKLRAQMENETDIDVLVERFTMTAAQISETPEAAKGGDLNRFKEGDFFPDFNEAIKGLQVGQMSQVFKSPIGFHLVLLTEKNDGTFENNRFKILQAIVAGKTQQNQMELEKYLKELTQKFEVKYLNSRYKGDVSVNMENQK